jgi:hypothetical protein
MPDPSKTRSRYLLANASLSHVWRDGRLPETIRGSCLQVRRSERRHKARRGKSFHEEHQEHEGTEWDCLWKGNVRELDNALQRGTGDSDLKAEKWQVEKWEAER